MAKRNCVTFIWKISNLFRTNWSITSPEFYVNSLRESGWILRLHIPSSMSEEVTIDLSSEYYKKGPGLLHIDYEISIVAENPLRTVTQAQENISFSQDSEIEVDGFPSWYTLTHANKDEYFRDGIITIQCKLWKRNVKYKDLTPLFYQAYTRLGWRKISLDWSLNFSDLKEGKIQTKKFFLDQKQPIFNVETFTESSKQTKIGFKIEQNNSDFNELHLSCKISVLDASGSVSIWKECYKEQNLGDVFSFPPFIRMKYLRDHIEKCIKDNELKLIFDFTFEIEDDGVDEYSLVECISKYPPENKPFIQSQSTPKAQNLGVRNPLFSSTPNLFIPEKKTTADANTSTDKESDLITQALKDDLHDIYLANSWSDVVLEAKGRSFPCHKCILSARSPVFHSLLTESTTYTLGLELKASVLGRMLQFFYTGDIGTQMDFQIALELYEAATEYQVISLKNVCAKFLEDNISEQNACDVLIVASKLRDITLKTNTEDFILKRASILCSERWKDLVKNDAEYIVETMHRIYLGKERRNISSLLLKPLVSAFISDYAEKSTVEHQSNFLSIYKSSLFSDFKLRTKNGKTFAAHKNILWARSPVLKAMLSSNMKESSMTTLDIHDIDEQTLEQFLSFLYSGKVETAELEELSKLYFSADKYQILSLKEWCSKSLVRALSLKNVCDVLILSDEYRDEKFKNEVLDFLAMNDESVILSPEWKSLMQTNSQLVSETVYQIYVRKMNLSSANAVTESDKSISESNLGNFSEIDAATILQVDLVSLYDEKCFSDCKLCTNDRTFEVHKNILCARSPVFNAMFSSSLEEATTNTLVIPDIDGQTVDQMLRYVYTGTFEFIENRDLCKLYYAADKYQINSLRDWCSHLLSEGISVENACEILLLANRHGDDDLETAVRNFLVRNSEEVFQSDYWKDFMLNEPAVSCQTMLAIY